MGSFLFRIFSSIFFFSNLLIPQTECSFHFKFPSFRPNEYNISYHGDAKANGAVTLTDDKSRYRVGWVTFANSVHLWNAKKGGLYDFTTNFSFSIKIPDVSDYGHGFAFFLAPAGVQIPPNSGGQYLGLFNQTKSIAFPIVMVEFDSYHNSFDPKRVNTHIGINVNSLISANFTSWNTTRHDGDIANVTVSYFALTKNLTVSWNYLRTNDPGENSSLSHIIDLSHVLPELVTIGFSASTGMANETHILYSWEFSSSLDAEEENNDLNDQNNGINIGLVIGLPVSGFVLVIIGSVIFGLMRKQSSRRRKTEQTRNLTNGDLRMGPRQFSYSDLASATSNFSIERKLGQGGFGAVYRGYIHDLDAMIAVKKFSGGRSKQGQKEFLTEVRIISSLRHRNLVQLLGWCSENDEFLIVYEFMSNGSLDSHLFGKRVANLSWATRYKITLGLASALLYLQEEWEQCVVHRDIKPSNIMLDSNFNAKLGDFGLARLMDHEVDPQTTGLAGTFGYMAPEYISTGRASKESDVYSFGVVALEIATGKKSGRMGKSDDKYETTLVEWVWERYGKGEILSTVDDRLSMQFDKMQIECVMIVGLWCVHPDNGFRPSMKQAIQALAFEVALPNLPSSMPVPAYHVSSDPSSSYGEATATFTSARIGR